MEKCEEPELQAPVSEPVTHVSEPEHRMEKPSEPVELTATISEVPSEPAEHPEREDKDRTDLVAGLSVTPVVGLPEDTLVSSVTPVLDLPIDTSATSVTPVVGEPEDLLASNDPDARGVRIYTDTTEGVPQVERDVQETEEVLPDGTVVRRQVVKTSQRQTISTRVVMEGPEDVLPTSKAEAEQLLGEMGVGEGHQVAISDSEPQASTNVEEHEEVLPDGTVVKRRVVTTTKQHVTTERVSLEDDDIPAGSTAVD